VADLRVSDRERDAAVQELREHFAAGRLTEDEFNERVQAAYEARTEGQLNGLLSDLPRLPATQQQLRAELVQRRRHLQRRMIQESGGGLALFVICVAVWATNGTHGGFWPALVALFVVIPLIRNGWRLYGPSPQLDRVERELDRRSRGGGRHRGRR
jgi:hypothetical protein